jgi:hypothetical protein
MSKDYWELPGLEQVYLADSWVLGIEVDQQHAAFQLQLVLTEDHPRYQPRRPGEQYCYAPARLAFEGVEWVELQPSGAPPSIDASGEQDSGHIYTLCQVEGGYIATGNWGELRVGGGRVRIDYR